MPNTSVVAKVDFLPFFKKGDKATIIPIYYEKDTVIVNSLHGIKRDGKVIGLTWFQIPDDATPEQLEARNIVKISDEVIAPKGSFKSCSIKLNNGNKYSTSILGSLTLSQVFEKI